MTSPRFIGALPRALAPAHDPVGFRPESALDRLLASGLGQASLRGGAGERRSLETEWGSGTLAELEALRAEGDPALFAESLLAIGQRLVAEDRLAAAQRIFSACEELALAPAVSARAHGELDAILGRGAWGARAEFLGRRFAREAASPSMLVGMTAASVVFQFSRFALLSRLTASPTVSFLTRGLGARSLAGLGAFALEAPSFALAARGVRSLTGEGRGEEASWGQEILGSYLTLGGLKMFGALGAGAVRWTGDRSLSRALIPQLSAYFGIVAGHRLEQWVGLRPTLSGDTLWLDSLATLLQFHVGGRMAQSLGGPSFAGWQAELEARSAVLERRLPPETGPGTFLPGEALAWAGPASGVVEAGPKVPALPTVMMMHGGGPRGRRGPANGAGRSGGGRPAAPAEPNSYQVLQEVIRRNNKQRGPMRDRMSLWQTFSRMEAEGKIPEGLRDEVHWAVFSRSLFENSRILKDAFSPKAVLDVETTVRLLHRLRDRVAAEHGQERYSLATLVQALVYGGWIPFDKLRRYVQAAASFDFYQETPSLQKLSRRSLADPYRLIETLRPLVPEIAEARDQSSYRLATLIDAARWNPNFPVTQLQHYKRVGAADDLVSSLPRARLRLEVKQLRELTVEQIYLRLLHLRSVIRGEQGEPVSIGTVLIGLRSHGLNRVRGGAVNDSAVTNAHVLDFVFSQWGRWGGHYRNLVQIPRYVEGTGDLVGWTRMRYSERFFLKDDGQPYKYNYRGNMVRWAEFLWEHREALHLPEPKAQRVPTQGASARGRLLNFLEPHWEALKGKTEAPEDLFQELAELRHEFVVENGGKGRGAQKEEVPSLMTMAAAFFRSKDREMPSTLRVYAHLVDSAIQRWPEWREHFRRISQIPSRTRQSNGGETRLGYAAKHLRQANGEGYSDTILSGLIRWGTWVWERRHRLGLRSGNSTMPPPRGDGE